ncbi:mitochondrial import receptor subunit TOM40 homolog 2 isoform X2 [Musca domestica]|uniref:Mitochondrial import receptor subunit TOM40 homolog 2 isoform X2 n=1 Tax=Musca domestica TaxID=7370 RepID=A0A1I8M8W6_MUSDO|nr:mitochondrial import receptor subunit TOM40 homolog 2 isoform X2 [Musca domestica]
MNDYWCPPKCNAKFPPCFEKHPGVTSKSNPGNILGLHNLANRIKPSFLDGIRLNYRHSLKPNKMLTASWRLSHNEPSGFRFGGIYTVRLHGDVMQTPTIYADINPANLSTDVGIVYHPYPQLRVQAEMQRAALGAPTLETQTCIELSTHSATLTGMLYNARRESGQGTLSYLRAINDKLSVGGELSIEWTDPYSMMTDIAFAARFRQRSYSIAATISCQGVDVSYWQRLHRRIQMATLWAWQRKTEQSLATICYQWNFEDAHVRGQFDSNLSVGFIYSRVMPHIPLSMDMSLLINFLTNRFVFGVNFTLDPSGLRRGE